MSLWDVLTGKQPLMKPRGAVLVDIENEYRLLINSTTPYQWRKKPDASPAVLAAAIAEDNRVRPRSYARYTLFPGTPTKVADTQGEEKTIYVTVPGVGQTCFISHDRVRLQNSQGGITEGIPLTNSGLGEPGRYFLQWNGEMWAIADPATVDGFGNRTGMTVDVEMS